MSAAKPGPSIAPPRAVFFLIFTISGFSGLIYESIWTHYLKLFLGHAAYAQSLVLSIFMGGMALGAWLAGRYSERLRAPILGYAIVEVVIGLCAMVFHPVFTGVTGTMYDTVLPGLDSGPLAHALKWSVAAGLIVPQSILLGMTFPLMTAGVLRRFPIDSGGSIAVLYFTNSIGAAFGVLASGFWLIKSVGLPGTVMTAGILNVSLALVVWTVLKLDPVAERRPSPSPPAPAGASNRLLLLAAFVTGLASFIYEIGWIRMLSLVLGSSTHAFELMLSAFITGLALGGLWIRRRIDAFESPLRVAAYVQVIMGLLAILTVPIYGQTFDWMLDLRLALERNETGYTLFMFASHAIVLVIMLPTTFCAGMTLPLFTHALLKSGYGERGIGHVYASNTLGSIIGVLFAVHIGLPMLGLKSLIGSGAILDIALGLLLLVFLWREGRSSLARILATAGFAGVSVVTVLSLGGLSEARLSSGVFRYDRTEIPEDNSIRFYRDGRTASVSVYGNDQALSLATNGKPDARIGASEPYPYTLDEATMALLGALPFAFNPDATRVANIGLGSGMTTHTILALPQVERVDTVEIEAAVIEGSRAFGDWVARAHTDPRSHIHIEDAKTFFTVNHQPYDIIVSEPSNPWVSGIASLFTDEFYALVKRYLRDGGVMAQWLHLYETDLDNVVSILRAIDNNFSDYRIYGANFADVIIVARRDGDLPRLDSRFLLDSALGESLRRLDIRTPSDLEFRLVGGRELISAMLRLSDAPVNSDYYPFLDQHAHRAFFLGTDLFDINLHRSPLPVLELLEPDAFSAPRRLTPSPAVEASRTLQYAHEVIPQFLAREYRLLETAPAGTYALLSSLDHFAERCDTELGVRLWLESWHQFVSPLLGVLEPAEAEALLEAPQVAACAAGGGEPVENWLALYRAVAARDGAAMARAGEPLIGQSVDPGHRGYALAAAVLGHLSVGQIDAAWRVWQRNRGVFPSLEDVPFYLRVVAQRVLDEMNARAEAGFLTPGAGR